MNSVRLPIGRRGLGLVQAVGVVVAAVALVTVVEGAADVAVAASAVDMWQVITKQHS